MKTLYVSDLDGTLLRSDETISEYTAQTINRLTTDGMLFSYATARSYHTAKKVTNNFSEAQKNEKFCLPQLNIVPLYGKVFKPLLTQNFL